MGYDIIRFQGEVDEELLCPICSGVLEEPVQAPLCEHAFCKECINEWLSRQHSCPVDRQPMTAANLIPVPRILRNLLSRLQIFCSNASLGCTVIVKLDRLDAHHAECDFNPKKQIPCEQGCGLIIPKDELKEHNCVKELRGMVHCLQQKISDLHSQMADQRREILMVKASVVECIRAIRISNPNGPAIVESIEQDEAVRWCSSLQRARVTRWGGMISTPDSVLQAMVRRALSESGCPPHITDELMENAHERRWPPGLSTLETRQTNRRYYENYVCKRIPGKQAVVVMAIDNPHMNEDMVLEPGLVMIFAHGIE